VLDLADWAGRPIEPTLPDDQIICPGHDYGDVPEATVGDQKRRSSAFTHTDYEAFAKEWYLVAY
jgi:hypothetical protein